MIIDMCSWQTDEAQTVIVEINDPHELNKDDVMYTPAVHIVGAM